MLVLLVFQQRAGMRRRAGAAQAGGQRRFAWRQPFVGQRRYVMFNWVRSDAALTRQLGRHKLSARIKKLIPFFYKGK